MKKLLLIAAVFMSLLSCKQTPKNDEKDLAQVNDVQEKYKSYGEQITADNALSAKEMSEKYDALQTGDTITAKFVTTVNSVCKMKGCWMTLDLPDAEESPMVKFKDYGFFVPKDIEGEKVIVEGIAFIEETSVEDQKHFAEDAGKSKEEIEQITEAKRSPGFLAHGVLIEE